MKIKTVCAPDAPGPAVFAAAELERYLTRMLAGEAGTLTVALAVRPDGAADQPDRFRVKLDGAGGRIEGNSGRAVLLGAYDCLRRLGCRFLGPGPHCERVPALSRAALAADYESRASFRHRGVCIEGADSRENILEFIDWLPKAGYNSFFLQFKNPYAFLKRWYRHEGNPLAAPEPYTPADGEADMALLEREVKKRGLLLHRVGHGWTGEVLGYDALSWDAEQAPLPEEKKPLAAQVNGVRGLYGGVSANTNLCFSGGAAEDLARRVVRFAGEHPDTDCLHVWLADTYNNVCECEACRQTTPSDQYVELLNEIDRRLTQAGLDTRIVFLLYQELLWPPVRARLKHPDRFVLMFAPISRTFERSYEVEGALPELPPYVRNHITLPTDLGENLAFLRGWQRQFGGDSFVYDYPLGRAHYGDLGYVHIARVIGGDVKRLEALGLDGYISCQELRAGLPNFLPNYVMGRMLFDRDADPEAVIDEYFAAAYGAGWERVKEYLSALSALSSCDYVNGKGPRTDPDVARRMAELRRVCEHFSPVLEARRGEGLFWTVLAYHRDYALALSRALELLARGAGEESRAARRAFRELICENEPDFQPFLDVYRVLEVTEHYTGFPAEA